MVVLVLEYALIPHGWEFFNPLSVTIVNFTVL